MNLPRLLMRLLLGRRLPISAGTLTVPGIEHEVVIRRDGWGVPHIEAAGDADGWFGLGFCHGQDRAFQLESTVRVVRGTVAEIAGKEAIPIDRLSRRVGIAHAAKHQLAICSPVVRTMIEAYARGVNAGTTVGTRRKAHELVLLRSESTAWTAVDVLGYVKMTSLLLATNWDVELARLKILTEDGPEALAALDPAYPEWQPVISPPGVPAGPALDRLLEDASALLHATGGGGGSNSWSIAPARTSTGRPIFANDPHLSPSLPPHWYLAHITTPEWSAAGASFVGAPGFPVGHNGFAAWGVTVGMTDNTDLFVEEIGIDGRSCRQDGAFIPCEVRTERIAVKGQEEIVEEVVVTPRGPVIGPALDGEVGAVSLRAVWLDRLPIDGLLHVHRARSFEEFRRALAEWPAVPLSMAYADDGGTIGWQLIGTAPRRRKGHGAVPLAGSDPDAGWEPEHLPYEQLPYVVDPDEGFVATANNKAVRDGEGPFLTVDWIEGYRAERIVESLRAQRDWDRDATSRLQLDVACIPWREMREIVLSLTVTDPAARRALALLRDWDGVLSVDSPAASVFELFVAEMSTRVVGAKAPRSREAALGHGFHALMPHNTFAARRVGQLVRLLREQPAGWFPRSWEAEMSGALATAVARLERDHGKDVAGWAWGRIRTLTLVHPMGTRKPFDRVFNLGPFPWGGDSNTLGQAGLSPLEPTANPGFIASLRMVVEPGAWEDARFVLPGGQSGNPLSPHYADQLPLWQRGGSIRIPWSRNAVERATKETLRITP